MNHVSQSAGIAWDFLQLFGRLDKGPADFELHRKGEKRLIAHINVMGASSFGAIVPDPSQAVDVVAMAKKVLALKLPLLVIRSPNGAAVLWYFSLRDPVREVRAALTQYATLLGLEGAEIFPPSPDEARGGGIGIPYFGDANAEIQADGEAVTCEQFVEHAKALRDEFLDWERDWIVEDPEPGASDESAARIVAPHWNLGKRDKAGVAITNILMTRGWPDARLNTLIDRIAVLGFDEEREARTDPRTGFVAKVKRSIARGKRRTGIPTLTKLIGEDATEAFLEACGLDEGVEADAAALSPALWLAPLDILHEVAAPAFSADDVPRAIGEYAIAWGRSAGFDATGLIAAGVVTAAAALHDGIQLEVERSTKWNESARLWGARIAPPGEAKTPMIKAAVAPLQEIHRELVEAHALTLADPLHELEGEEAEHVPLPATFTSDATTMALSNILVDNPRGILYLAHELHSWLGSHDAFRKSDVSFDRGQWLELFDGGPHQIDRVVRGSLYLSNWGVSLLSATTPKGLMDLKSRLSNDGLLQRVLAFFTKPPTVPDPDHPTETEGACYALMIRTVYEFASGERSVEFSQEARTIFRAENDRYRALAPACASINEGLSNHVAKYGTFLARLVLTFHAVECASGPGVRQPTDVKVSGQTVEIAIRFLRKCFLHARALYDLLSGSDSALQLARDVAGALVADRYERVARRELVQRLPSFRSAGGENGRNTLQVQSEAMQLLCDFNWCRTEKAKYDKGYPTTWTVNPAIHAQFVEYGVQRKRRRAVVKDAILAAHAERSGGAA